MEATGRSGTQVGQNKTRTARREASKNESQKRSEPRMTSQKLLVKFRSSLWKQFVHPPDKEGSLKK